MRVSWLWLRQAGGHGGIEDTGLWYFSTSSLHIGRAGSDKQPREQREGGSILEMSPSQSSTVAEGDPCQPCDAAEGPQGKMGKSAQATGTGASRAVPTTPALGRGMGTGEHKEQSQSRKSSREQAWGAQRRRDCVSGREGRCPLGVSGAETSKGPHGTGMCCGADQGNEGSPQEWGM